MATGSSEQWEMIERWKAEHPSRLPAGGPAPQAPPPRLANAPAPSSQASGGEQRELIERWKREHADRNGQSAAAALQSPGYARPVAQAERSDETGRRALDIADTPLTVLSAFIIGCIVGGIAMTIITGIAFWGFSSG